MNEKAINKFDKNPLSDLISDNIYVLLASKGFIHNKNVRDYHIRKKFIKLRDESVAVIEALERLRVDYPYLQFDTLRKIVYRSV